MAEKPIRNHLTAGITFVLGAIGRVCTRRHRPRVHAHQ
jgi:hypothetical protein